MRTTAKQRAGGVTGKGFLPGKSGNPGGRPKGVDALRAELEKRYGGANSKLLDKLELLRVSANPKVSLEATKLILAYWIGLPSQSIEIGQNPDSEPIAITFRVVRHEAR